MARFTWLATTIGSVALALAPGANARAETLSTRVELLPAPVLAAPPLPDPGTFPIQLVVDDDSAEAVFGVIEGVGSRQFLAFQRFASPGEDFRLQEVWILFPSSPTVPAGAPVEIGIFRDPDGDPTNGATLLSSWATTVQVADGVTFSIYPLPAALTLEGSGDILIGFANRYITSGGPPVSDVLIDTTATAGRSWLAVWSGADPPSPLALPGGLVTARLDDLTSGGNWMIRGFGIHLSILEVPAIDRQGATWLALLLATAGLALTRRRNRGSREVAQ